MTPRLYRVALVMFLALPVVAYAATDLPEERMISDVRPSEPVVPETTAVVQSSKEVADFRSAAPLVVSGTTPAVRGEAFQATGLPPVPNPMPVDGDCDTWRPLLERYGLPWSAFERIAERESGCSHAIADRPSTGDLSAGILQANFYGYLNDMWESAGWSWQMVRDDAEAAVAAAGALYLMCGGTGPWTPPYSCDGNVLPTPDEMGLGS